MITLYALLAALPTVAGASPGYHLVTGSGYGLLSAGGGGTSGSAHDVLSLEASDQPGSYGSALLTHMLIRWPAVPERVSSVPIVLDCVVVQETTAAHNVYASGIGLGSTYYITLSVPKWVSLEAEWLATSERGQMPCGGGTPAPDPYSYDYSWGSFQIVPLGGGTPSPTPSTSASPSPSTSASPSPTTTTPGAPQNLSASGYFRNKKDRVISLSWQAPASDGGAAVTSYRIYRGTSPGAVALLATTGNTLSYVDTATTPGRTYYYRVAAVNAKGEGPQSNEASATAG